jgi:hypothetical protein
MTGCCTWRIVHGVNNELVLSSINGLFWSVYIDSSDHYVVL